MFDSTEDWCKIWRKIDLRFLDIFVYRLKNSDFILESKMEELYWKQNLYTDSSSKLSGCSLFSRVGMMNTFVIVNITTTYKR